MNLALIQPIAQPQSLPKTNRYTAYASNVIAPTKDANLEEQGKKEETSPLHLTALKTLEEMQKKIKEENNYHKKTENNK